jgi:HAD superfamily hydrolase (TIGR01509 family)
LREAFAARAVIWDVDGTLYQQQLVRYRMLLRLLARVTARPLVGLRELRILSAYRSGQEILRSAMSADIELAQAQLEYTARRSGVPIDTARKCVERWMEAEPLDLLTAARREGIPEILANLQERNVRLGVLSDYPASKKLMAMGIAHYFDAVVCAQDEDVQRFKPDPRGLQVVMDRLGVDPSEALYIGDRPEVDREAAVRAGVNCIIIGTHCGGLSVRNVRLLLDLMASEPTSDPLPQDL